MFRASSGRSRRRVNRRLVMVETLESRRMLAGAQYTVNHSPHLQLGNAPLVGTPDDDGMDQIEILWQTLTEDEAATDEFLVEYRQSGRGDWQAVPLNEPIAASITRTVHSATIGQLAWNTEYDYRVHHVVNDAVETTYDGTFQTRLAAGDETPFSFASYGDSFGEGYRAVQRQINRLDPSFALLLGDILYDSGFHTDTDDRFSPIENPPATIWHAEHVDYLAVGNHDVFNRARGQPMRDNFSVPLQQAGVNSYATVPEEEPPEHNYSFDYGNVHFVTIDTNSVEPFLDLERFERQIDYAIRDLEASNAQWKIMFAHHPMLGTDKPSSDLDGLYFQMMLPRLREASVDLLLTGHSHTYSWTFPATGFHDENADGTIAPDEVNVVADRRHVFHEEDGLVQVVAGSTGRAGHDDDYAEHFIAQAYSRSELTAPMEAGFAHVEVFPDRLRVSYVSGESGEIVGDKNGNGQKDYGEDDFGQFAIVATPALGGDLTADGRVDPQDIRALCHEIQSGQHRDAVDLNGDGSVDQSDMDYLVRQILETDYGDATLDGIIDSTDLIEIFRAGEYDDGVDQNSTWSTGDFDCDGEFDSADLVMMFRSGSYTSGVAAVQQARLNDVAAALAAEEAIRQARGRP